MIPSYIDSLRENNYRYPFENSAPKNPRRPVSATEEYICELTPELVAELESRSVRTLRDLAKFTTALGIGVRVTLD